MRSAEGIASAAGRPWPGSATRSRSIRSAGGASVSSGSNTTDMPKRCSIRAKRSRLRLSRYSATGLATCTAISAARRLAPSSSMARSTDSALLSMLRTWPRPWQCGQATKAVSVSEGAAAAGSSPAGRSGRCGPPGCGRGRAQRLLEPALHGASCRLDSMSMKSITMRPARSRRRSCRAISSAASMLVRNAVSSMCRSRVERPEFTSMATSASVWLMTT
jgi:hypothetical protein